jgi:malonyl-CoA/methylmalonyl-CoA synthetase
MGATLFSKSTQIFRPKFDLHDALDWMPKSTVFIGVPTFYSRLMSDTKAFNKDRFKNIRVFICGSAPLTPANWNVFREHTGHPILERYGMSESKSFDD